MLTFKRKLIIRNQSWSRAECELPHGNLIKGDALNGPYCAEVAFMKTIHILFSGSRNFRRRTLRRGTVHWMKKNIEKKISHFNSWK